MAYNPEKTKKGPGEIDAFAGKQLRQRRKELGWSQPALGFKIGISYQMIQKYEQGSAQLTIARLDQVATALSVARDYFFRPPAKSAPETQS